MSLITPERITYDPRTGRYRSEFGGFLSAADIKVIVREERQQLEGKLLRLIDQYIDNKISGRDLQIKAINEFKYANLRTMTIGAGGRKSLNDNKLNSFYFEETRKDLRAIAERLDAMLGKHQTGQISDNQFRGWAKYRSNSVFAQFHKSEQMTRIGVQGANEALRTLDISSNHCPSCPALATDDWQPIESVTPVGSNCECGGRCRCTVKTRFNPALALQQIGKKSFAGKVEELRRGTKISA
jgi:hypothetical protein